MIKIKSIAAVASLVLGFAVLTPTTSSAAPLTSSVSSLQTQFTKYNVLEETQFRRRRFNRRRNRRRRNRRRNRNLLLGLGAAAVIGGAIAHNNRANARPPQRRYRARYEPWTDAWYDDCSRRYRSFNPNTGYFRSYNRGYVFCR